MKTGTALIAAILIVVLVGGTVVSIITTSYNEAIIAEEAFLKTQLNPEWEEVVVTRPNGHIVTSVGRTKTPTGWLIYSHQNVTFIPDPKHTWLVAKVEK